MSKLNINDISKKIAPVLNKIQKSKLSNGISGGMMAAMPVILLGAFSALFLNLRIPAWKSFIAFSGIEHALNVAILFSTNFLAVAFVLTIAGSYAKQYKEEPMVPSLIALVCFFIVTPFTTNKGVTTFTMQWLGAAGIFSAIIIGLVSTRIYIYIKRKGFTIKMPASVPPVVANSFISLIPAFAAIIVFLIVSTVFSGTHFETMHQFIYTFIQTPLQGAGGNIVTVVILWTFAQLLWFCGIHGTLVIYSVVLPIFTAMDTMQLSAYAAGQSLPNITGRAFVSTYTMSGSAIGFAILMLFVAKSKQYKALGKITTIPALFGISEPLVFGTPLVFNFKFLIPFVFLNGISLTIAYALTAIGIVPRVAGISGMSGMPIIFSGLMEGSWKIAVLQVALVLLSMLVWYPFFKKADNEAYKVEQKAEV
ncbi:PTS sugar transporter subunit IIC [Clostridium estertheticum]|uniref:Permease IIC component n=1 Tax=Clostridium estertheticum TaxID=238834 RepID=A0A5N7IJK7_9CLOT|nr:PTS transporter subunit EIIC [Clostridium estertheticum]MCB2339002.1 PTS transporter subunit EIIC [Clostridium estertheticum]MPQ30485.1 PTS sugar transporter subunit IIC [Clostridium estertheticum]MPQ61161.1 PTS sugar transporter subunit IIC [Clostridium estertheticum]